MECTCCSTGVAIRGSSVLECKKKLALSDRVPKVQEMLGLPTVRTSKAACSMHVKEKGLQTHQGGKNDATFITTKVVIVIMKCELDSVLCDICSFFLVYGRLLPVPHHL